MAPPGRGERRARTAPELAPYPRCLPAGVTGVGAIRQERSKKGHANMPNLTDGQTRPDPRWSPETFAIWQESRETEETIGALQRRLRPFLSRQADAIFIELEAAMVEQQSLRELLLAERVAERFPQLGD